MGRSETKHCMTLKPGRPDASLVLLWPLPFAGVLVFVFELAISLGAMSAAAGATSTEVNWTALDGGVSNKVWALAVSGSGSNGNVYAGGEFTLAGGNSANYVARWNGMNWLA